MNQPTNAVKIIDLSTMFSKKDIKRELKANGFGSVDVIVFEKGVGTYNHTVLVWFRPTTKRFVIETRSLLTERFENSKRGIVDIPVRCAEIELNGKWYLMENKSLRPDDMMGRVTELEKIIENMESKLKRHEDILHQLIGGLFNQSKQRDTIDFWQAVLFDTPYSKSNQEDPGWPTTRQGDDLEVEVKDLKSAMARDQQKIADLEDKLKRLARPHRTRIVDTESDDQCLA